MDFPILLIVVVEFCERLCYYTFQGTQKAWLQDQGFTNAYSNSLVSLFASLSIASCFVGGWLAETRFGRFRTIAWLALVYTIGCFLVAYASRAGHESVTSYVFGMFALIALGTGGIKPNVSTFGADQVDPLDALAVRKREAFFSYFYVSINVGSVVACGFLSIVAINGIGKISEESGFLFAYLVAACTMALALMIFLGGAGYYRRASMLPNSESGVSLWVNCLLSGWEHPLGKLALLGWFLIPCLIVASIVNAFVDVLAMTYMTLALSLICITCLCVSHYDNTWLSRNEVTKCLDCVPTLLIGNISFALLYNTMSTALYSQACQMDTRLGSSPSATQFNGTFFTVSDSVAIILFTPMLHNICIPSVERLLKIKVTLNMKFYAGISCGISSQLAAALLEHMRLRSPILSIPSTCAPLRPDGEHVRMSGISAFWMFIPNFLIGMGEVFVVPVMMNFAYEGASPSMRSLMQAFQLFAFGGIPGFISAAMNLAEAKLTPNNLNNGNLLTVYYINIALAIIGCGLYYLVSVSRDRDLLEKAKLTDSENQPSYG